MNSPFKGVYARGVVGVVGVLGVVGMKAARLDVGVVGGVKILLVHSRDFFGVVGGVKILLGHSRDFFGVVGVWGATTKVKETEMYITVLSEVTTLNSTSTDPLQEVDSIKQN